MQRAASALVALCALAYFLAKRNPASLKQSPDELHTEYDYVIVGGGSAGCVLAARLTEYSNFSVLLLEAGGVPPSWSQVPAYSPQLQLTEFDWQYKTVPQTKACKGFANQQSAWPRGKVLGGSSSVNYLQYTRGHPKDYERWAELTTEQWNYRHVLPYFKKSEDIRVEELNNSKFHGHGGPLKIGRTIRSKLGHCFLEAAKSAGFTIGDDYNDLAETGFTFAQQTIHDGVRQSTYEAFLRPALNRQNLHVLTNAQVTKINFEGNVATGVDYFFADKTHKVNARREVVISAGAIGSPQLLMLSGVGPKAHLEALSISLVKDLPSVGEHLVDHTIVDLFYTFNQSVGLDVISLDSFAGYLARVQYFLFKTGPLAHMATDVTGFLWTWLTKTDDRRPDLQFSLSSGQVISPSTRSISNLNDETFSATFGQGAAKFSASFSVFLSHPMAEGTIRLSSKNPLEHPLIDPNYPYTELDVAKLRQGLKVILKIANAEPFKKYGIQIGEKPLPSCEKLTFLSEAYLECLVEHRAFTSYHPACTCRMGKDASSSVVDETLRVHGIRQLRVIDASAFPDHVSGNTNAPVIMMAEKAADLILDRPLLAAEDV